MFNNMTVGLAHIKSLFISHFDKTNQIDLSYGNSSTIFILLILLMLILLSIRRRTEKSSYCRNKDVFSFETTTMIRGIAIIFLLIGHLSEKCIGGIGWFEDAGRWAVVMFLFVSGIALSKKHGIENLGKKFFLGRIRRLAVPFWLTLVLFVLLDYLLVGYYYSYKRLILAFGGVMFPWPPNGPAWFITYIIVMYIIYFLTSLFRCSFPYKSILLFIYSYSVMFLILYTKLNNSFALWVIYTAVFPAAVTIGLFRDKIFVFLKRLYNTSMPIYYIILIGLFIVYYQGTSIDWLSQPSVMNKAVHTLQPLSLTIFLTMLAYLFDSLNYIIPALITLGEYSFEIYLLHFPFMEHYDFILFRKPLVIMFFTYFAVIFLMSYLLRKVSKTINKRLFVL